MNFPRMLAAGITAIIALETTSASYAARIGFSGHVVAPAQRALMPESDDIITFTDRVGIRFSSANTAMEPVKMKLRVRNSAGHEIKPVSISGRSVVQPKNQNLITLVLPMARTGNEVFELCLQHVNRAKSVLSRTCSKLSVARLD
ncbi:MAG: hypothetical protein AAGF25_14440 [Pseudomonadota bacterium]